MCRRSIATSTFFRDIRCFAPTGIGVVYGKSEVLDNMPPWQGGGNMIQDVTFEKTLYQPPPQRFEAGTGNIADAVGLGAAIDYLDRVGIANVARHEHTLCSPMQPMRCNAFLGCTIIGTAKEKAWRDFPLLWMVFVPKRSATISTARALRCAAVIIAHSRFCAASVSRARSAQRWRSTTRARKSMLVAALWDLRQGRNPGLA
jgi:cysteine desulfurase/selenocysteine lyase